MIDIKVQTPHRHICVKMLFDSGKNLTLFISPINARNIIECYEKEWDFRFESLNYAIVAMVSSGFSIRFKVGRNVGYDILSQDEFDDLVLKLKKAMKIMEGE